jgi:hypothetical protein
MGLSAKIPPAAWKGKSERKQVAGRAKEREVRTGAMVFSRLTVPISMLSPNTRRRPSTRSGRHPKPLTKADLMHRLTKKRPSDILTAGTSGLIF